ncbi:MAG: porin [Candidatus Puniceispirillales bacterium]
MRKLLLGTTALAAAATLTANAALADVSISGGYEFKYVSRSSSVNVNDGTTMNHGDSDMTINFNNKTDSGLDITYRADFDVFGDTETGSANMDEVSLTIAGGFGKIVLGRDDDAADAYNIDESDLIAEDASPAVASMTISTSSSISSDDAMKVAYHMPAMGGLTAGISHTDRSAVGGTDTTSYGLQYAMEAAGASVTLGYAIVADENATQDVDQSNLGVKIVSGDISMILATGGYEANDEDRSNAGAAISYKMPNGLTVGAYTFRSEDDLDIGEKYTKSGLEVQYPIASGLTAVLNLDDYNYKEGTSDGTHATLHVDDQGQSTALTIKAAF